MNGAMLRACFILLLMLAASALAVALRPATHIASAFDLEAQVPKQFGEWRVDPAQKSAVVNPQARVLIEKLYSQTLSRTYVNTRSGEQLMLSIAYGDDQSEYRQLHLPDLCYPASGFQVLAMETGVLQTHSGEIPVKRLFAVLGNRSEPLTYWVRIGNKIVIGGFKQKLAQLSYGLHGQIPDGLIFRVSSLSIDRASAYRLQELFVRQLFDALTPVARLRLAGGGD